MIRVCACGKEELRNIHIARPDRAVDGGGVDEADFVEVRLVGEE